MDIDDIFEEEYKKLKSNNTVDKIISEVENEFQSPVVNVQKSRELEVRNILKKIKQLKHDLQKCKNIRNSCLVKVNKIRSEKRKKIKKELTICNLRLQEIQKEG